jgi:hypothetical protein
MNIAHIKGKILLFESTHKKVDSAGNAGIFHLIILNTNSGQAKDDSPSPVEKTNCRHYLY